MKKIVWIILVLCFYPDLYAQPIPLDEREILQLQDQRSLGDGKLVAYLNHENMQLRIRAAIALANLQDTSAVNALAMSLNDKEVEVRAASAFALGQLKTEHAAEVLMSALVSENDPHGIAKILEALGKCGSQRCLDSILSMSENDSAKFQPKELALCIARFAIRQIRTERSVWKCFEYLKNDSPSECSAALYALWRSAPYGLIDLELSNHKVELMALAANQDSDIRMNLAVLLGKSKTNDSRELLDSVEQFETHLNDWHVWVQIERARAAISSSTEDHLPAFLGYLTAKNDHIKITALQLLRTFPLLSMEQSIFIDTIRLTLSELVNDTGEDEAVRGEALSTLGKLFPKELDGYQPWISNDQVTPRLKSRLLEGIANHGTKDHLSVLLQALTNGSNRVALAAWDFIKPMMNPNSINTLGLDSSERLKLYKDLYSDAITSLAKNDIGITTVVANLFADTLIFQVFKNIGLDHQIVGDLIFACKNLTHDDDCEAKQALLQALGTMNDTSAISFLEKELIEPKRSVAVEAAASLHQLTGKDYSSKLHPETIERRPEGDWTFLEKIKPGQRVRLITNRGDITLELMKEHAPFTVMSFVKLIKNKFYDGLSFHRVVQDFVVQGGDPRGDGWGGPGYSIRTELSTVNYERGSCGMASAGKDTEGSQFFITHIATPHLDGRYTIFAKVIQGMDVVDRLQIGDTMKSVQLVEE